MLRQRIITAVVLLAVLLPALFSSDAWPFVGLTMLVVAAGAWEWGRLNGCGQAAALGLGAACLLLSGGTWAAGWLTERFALFWALAALGWAAVGTGILARGVERWNAYPRLLRICGGIAVLWTTWLAVAQARVQGINLLLSILALVWVADVAAYFAGRAFGLRWTSRRLAPSISPGKSWEGVWGGMFGVVLVGLLWAWADGRGMGDGPSFYSRLLAQGPIPFVAGLLLLSAMSVVGDLVESLAKRAAGAKDSSGLLPGHGGVLDRIDALLPTLPVAMCWLEWAR